MAAPAAAPFGRVLTAMVTAFDDRGGLDLDGTAAVAEHLVGAGHDGLVVTGTTGEAPTLSVAETGAVLRTVLDAVAGRASVVAGVGTNNTAHSVELAEQARKLGADGVLLVTPYYSKPTQEGVLAHFRAVTAAADLPVMLYDIPGRSSVAIAPDTYARVAEDGRIVAVKDAVGDLARGMRIMAETGLAFYSGDDDKNLAWLTHGAVGVVSVTGHVAGRQHAALVAALDRGDLATARSTYARLIPLVEVMMTRAPGAATAKAAMHLRGVIASRAVRLPLVPAPDAVVKELRSVMTDLDTRSA